MIIRCMKCGEPGTRERPLFKASLSFFAWHKDCEPKFEIQIEECPEIPIGISEKLKEKLYGGSNKEAN